MTALRRRLLLADAGEAADLAAFLARLIHYDRAAAVRLQAGAGAVAVFGRPPSFEVLAVRTSRLAVAAGAGAAVVGGGAVAGTGDRDGAGELDVTVSAGELLEGIEEATGVVVVPDAVTGPPWAGVLPPRGGWRQVPGLPHPDAMRGVVAAAVAEFRARDEALAPEERTRAARDRIGREIWSRTLGETELPLRAVHAAQSLGFLRAGRPGTDPGAVALFAAGGWLRLRTPYGSIAVRRAGLGVLSVAPV
ncbi:hypothetical protein BGM19_14605 [Streptomyces agglomeratus]|uniref:hypothetical protein n=1 Tax=Streptomyces agglomeratus TaxID=285458 RepID=UPI0008545CFA|nr:hypothetical protein [Streptomyces agglomeratus]OEJ51641.1 hypothetical protein BGK72_13500 [Streptomyces agglomeratus]OEJ59044.1 hypothetical protein BGM19_14605 [Streptomyces agglomeratus]